LFHFFVFAKGVWGNDVFFVFFQGKVLRGRQNQFAPPSTRGRGGEQKTIRGSSYFRKKRKKIENEKRVFVSLFFRLFRFSSLPLALSFAPSSTLEEPTRPPQEEKRKKHKLKVFCLACFCVSLFVKKRFLLFLVFFRESQRATDEKEKTAKPPPYLLPFPRFFPLPTAAAIEYSLPALQAADDVGARGRGGREVVVDRVPHDRALRVVERVDGRDRGADGRDERALGLDVAADGRDLDADGLDVGSLGLDVAADRADVDEAGLFFEFFFEIRKRGEFFPSSRGLEIFFTPKKKRKKKNIPGR
jgi:hypothetical protein